MDLLDGHQTESLQQPLERRPVTKVFESRAHVPEIAGHMAAATRLEIEKEIAGLGIQDAVSKSIASTRMLGEIPSIRISLRGGRAAITFIEHSLSFLTRIARRANGGFCFNGAMRP